MPETATKPKSTKVRCVTCGKVGGKHTDYCPQGLEEKPVLPNAEVDGEPAIIDGTVPKPEPLISRPTLEEAMAEVDSAEKIEREFNEKLEIAKSAYKIAKDRLERAESVALEAYRDRSQMVFGEPA